MSTFRERPQRHWTPKRSESVRKQVWDPARWPQIWQERGPHEPTQEQLARRNDIQAFRLLVASRPTPRETSKTRHSRGQGERHDMNAAPLIEVAVNGPPKTVGGEALDPNSLHDWLALPIQHFIDGHPHKSRDELIGELCEVLAELIGSSTPSWVDARKLTRRAIDQMQEQVQRKFKAFERLRAQQAS